MVDALCQLMPAPRLDNIPENNRRNHAPVVATLPLTNATAHALASAALATPRPVLLLTGTAVSASGPTTAAADSIRRAPFAR
eukprot:1938019-Pyramimonas_sp.AAC.1